MTKAVWKGVSIAESDDVLLVEFASYFPLDSVAPGAVRESTASATYCHWKGVATYYDVVVDGEVNEGAAWGYNEPHEGAEAIVGRIAFWKGVEVEGKPDTDPLTDPGGPKGARTGHQALCWLLVRTEETSLSAARVEEETGLSGDALASALEHAYVKPYAQRYSWRFEDGAFDKG